LKIDNLPSSFAFKFNLRRYTEEWAPMFEKFDTDGSKSLNRTEMLFLLAEDNVMRAAHVSEYEPTFTYKAGPGRRIIFRHVTGCHSVQETRVENAGR